MRAIAILLILLGASLNIQARSLHIGACNQVFCDSLKPFTAEELLGQFDPAKHPNFIKVSTSLASKPDLYLRREAYDAFISMHKLAAKDGVQLTIISATRNFNYQKSIWERKWQREQYKGWSDSDKAKDILKYSSMPGCSRHHWGTDIDMNSLEPSYFTHGAGKKIYDWLNANAAKFGFYQTYTSKSNGRLGYDEEAWHWSYLPLAKPMLEQYNQTITYDMLSGFKGCEQAPTLQVIEVFVNGIEEDLKK
jgi:D-alanyl-D-alanine carboxypeptidase